jgi:hypothetical protein
MLFAVTAILTVLQLLCSPFLLESPRWLLARYALYSFDIYVCVP